jgi:hypothetical protein
MTVVWVKFVSGDAALAGINIDCSANDEQHLDLELPLRYIYKPSKNGPVLVSIADYYVNVNWSMRVMKSAILAIIPCNELDKDRWTSAWAVKFTVATNITLHRELAQPIMYGEKSYSEIGQEYDLTGKKPSNVYSMAEKVAPIKEAESYNPDLDSDDEREHFSNDSSS